MNHTAEPGSVKNGIQEVERAALGLEMLGNE